MYWPQRDVMKMSLKTSIVRKSRTEVLVVGDKEPLPMSDCYAVGGGKLSLRSVRNCLVALEADRALP